MNRRQSGFSHIGIELRPVFVMTLALLASLHALDSARGMPREQPYYFYVSTKGDDAWSGKLPAPNSTGTDGPFATLTRARDAIRQLKAADQFNAPVTVMVLPGVYYWREPLVLESQDSGTKEQPITYTGYPGEKPVISGGKRINGWQPYKGNIMRCPLPEAKGGKWKFRQLYFNGELQIRARWPNRDPQDPLYGGWAFLEAALPEGAKNPDAFRYEPGLSPRHWTKPGQAEVFIFPWYCWVNDIIPVKEIDGGNRVISLTRPVEPSFMSLMKGNRFIVENVLEELDQPGEWYLDSDTGTLYFWPPKGSVETGEVIAPVTDRLIELRGPQTEPIRHVTLSGFTFTQTLPTWPEQRHENFHSPLLRGEAVRLENAEDCRIENNLFHNLGGDGVRLQGYNARNQILGNEIASAGGQGISLASGGPLNTNTWADRGELARISRLYPKSIQNMISNNHIHHTGLIKKNGGAIHLYAINSVDNIISHNLIHDVPDKGMTMQDGFGPFTVEYNEIHHVALEISDTGGIMVNRWFSLEEDAELRPRRAFRYNLIHDVIGCGAYDKPREGKRVLGTKGGGRIWTPYYTWGIYFDNSGMNNTVFGNTVLRTVLGGVSMPVGDPRDNLFENNMLIDSGVYQADLRIGGSAATGNRFVKNILYYTATDAALLNVTPQRKQALGECDYNLYFPARGQPIVIEGLRDGGLGQWQQMGFDTHTIVSDPLFVDPARGDYRLRPESPAFKLGFRPIDIQRVGLLCKQSATGGPKQK